MSIYLFIRVSLVHDNKGFYISIFIYKSGTPFVRVTWSACTLGTEMRNWNLNGLNPANPVLAAKPPNTFPSFQTTRSRNGKEEEDNGVRISDIILGKGFALNAVVPLR